MQTPARIPIHAEGALAVIETVVAPDAAGPALHVLPSLDATFHVLEGRLTFQVADALFTALRGASVLAARGVPHTYANQSDQEARVLIVCTPAHELWNRSAGTIHRTDIVGPPLASDGSAAERSVA
jgi:quercetin dioxygenase-like cupin family protein